MYLSPPQRNPSMNETKIKCWVLYGSEYTGGLVFTDRQDALDMSKECRSNDEPAYVRVKYFTEKELEEIPEAD